MKTTTVSIAHSSKISSPYQLNLNELGSNSYYVLLDLFAENVLKEGHNRFEFPIQNYRCSSATLSTDCKQTSDENVLDLLIIGVLWNQYKGKWGHSVQVKKLIFNQLYQLRSTNATLKPLADSLRGKLNLLLDHPVDNDVEINLVNLRRLSYWLSATGDFKEEVLRISSWIRFLENVPESLVQILLIHVERFANWFEDEAVRELNSFTKGVGQFLSTQKAKYKGKEDYFFTGRKEVEYHLNMVGAAIMNRSMQKEFLETEHQILLLPSCMTKNEKCKSVEIMQGRVCTHCTKECNISRVTSKMNEKGVHTFIIKHSSSFSKYLERWANQKKIGLIGTACTLNLLMGGYEMKRLNIPAQCVFLDYCGCKKHWNEKGLATNINISQVGHLVNPLIREQVVAS